MQERREPFRSTAYLLFYMSIFIFDLVAFFPIFFFVFCYFFSFASFPLLCFLFVFFFFGEIREARFFDGSNQALVEGVGVLELILCLPASLAYEK